MDIQKSKVQIMNALRSYFAKDEYGDYIIPQERQRPVFLMGPPGVGKTAIMEQIASELGVGLLSYAMTQHTISTVLGQAYVAKKKFGGKEFDVTEYTMSEIITSVYELMEDTGIREGILFLDELNCVNETLSPIMLQFLQYKMVGRHIVPDGWLVVGAGNPLEYNSNAHDFDIVTWDRLKRVDVDPDLDVWKHYAFHKNLHQSILSYLEIQPLHFYRIESEGDSKIFITARSWDDLNEIMKLYEQLGIPVDENLTSQYIQINYICRNYTGFYNLYNDCREIFRIDDIVEGYVDDELMEIINHANKHEIVCLRGLLNTAISQQASVAMENYSMLQEIINFSNIFKENLPGTKNPFDLYDKLLNDIEKKNTADRKSGAKSKEKTRLTENAVRYLRKQRSVLKGELKDEPAQAVESIRLQYEVELNTLVENDIAVKIDNVIYLLTDLYDTGDEMETFIKDVEMNDHIMSYIDVYGCESYKSIRERLDLKHEIEANKPAPPPEKIEPRHQQLYQEESEDIFTGYLGEDKKTPLW